MDFEILGPLEVRDQAGNPIPIPGGRERALLAALLIHAGEAISADRLIEDLWGEHPPANATNALQAVVSRVRKALGLQGQDLLVTKAPGMCWRSKRTRWTRGGSSSWSQKAAG